MRFEREAQDSRARSARIYPLLFSVTYSVFDLFFMYLVFNVFRVLVSSSSLYSTEIIHYALRGNEEKRTTDRALKKESFFFFKRDDFCYRDLFFDHFDDELLLYDHDKDRVGYSS